MAGMVMDERPFSEPAPRGVAPDESVKAITVFLAGTMITRETSASCTVRSVAPGQVILETRMLVVAGDDVRVRLSDGRLLRGDVEWCKDGVVSLRLTLMPDWIEELYSRRSAA
ncbi:hypothetical protein [Novosphingobium album (ex Hu et al. 2023)]|uniref:PilZ domain-containing protein n=1 Tax=Novosphingobium album (ex Hu et al. 2023) TaxID=2930093 RepID=A0ABT0B3T5_9SPHN|nr:hypothetical protein [Novosphingobium album (ex Hu et al. 2023)]MCJ2179565.1 hypothetical protein [Novosphingobium album (ex Hu et al. 2023)]